MVDGAIFLSLHPVDCLQVEPEPEGRHTLTRDRSTRSVAVVTAVRDEPTEWTLDDADNVLDDFEGDDTGSEVGSEAESDEGLPDLGGLHIEDEK